MLGITHDQLTLPNDRALGDLRTVRNALHERIYGWAVAYIDTEIISLYDENNKLALVVLVGRTPEGVRQARWTALTLEFTRRPLPALVVNA